MAIFCVLGPLGIYPHSRTQKEHIWSGEQRNLKLCGLGSTRRGGSVDWSFERELLEGGWAGSALNFITGLFVFPSLPPPFYSSSRSLTWRIFIELQLCARPWAPRWWILCWSSQMLVSVSPPARAKMKWQARSHRGFFFPREDHLVLSIKTKNAHILSTAIHLLGIYSWWSGLCTRVFSAVLFLPTKHWKEPHTHQKGLLRTYWWSY